MRETLKKKGDTSTSTSARGRLLLLPLLLAPLLLPWRGNIADLRLGGMRETIKNLSSTSTSTSTRGRLLLLQLLLTLPLPWRGNIADDPRPPAECAKRLKQPSTSTSTSTDTNTSTSTSISNRTNASPSGRL